MTLKTSLIITGDASVAQKAVDDLRRSVEAAGAAGKAAGPGLAAVDQAAVGAAAAAKEMAAAQASAAAATAKMQAELGQANAAIGALTAGNAQLSQELRQSQTAAAGLQAQLDLAASAATNLAAAEDKAAGGSRAVSQAADAARTAQAAAATAARDAATAQETYGESLRKTATDTGDLVAANDQVTISTASVGQQLTEIATAQVAAAGGADVHAAAAAGLQGEIEAMIAEIAGGSGVFETMASRGGAFATALAAVAQESAGAKTGIDAAGTSGEAASVDLSGLGDTVKDVAGGVESMGGKLGSAAAILGGPWGAAIGIGINLLGGFIAGLIEGASEAENASVASDQLGRHVSDLGNFFDSTTGKINETNRALINFAIYSRQKENRDLRTQQAGNRTAGAAALSTSLRDLKPVFAERGLGRDAPRTVNADVDTALRSANADQALRAVATSNSGNAAVAAQLLAQRAQFAQAAQAIAKNDAEIRSLLSGTLDPSLRSQRSGAAPNALPRTPTGGRQGGRAAGRGTSVPGGVTADKAADDGQARLARELDQVIAKYLPATAAAKDYADELARIDVLAKSYDGKTATSGLTAEQATAARAALTAAHDKRLAEINLTPEAAAADDARKSIDGVIASLGREMAARQALDPIQRAMAEHQDELAKLSDVERQSYEAKLRSLYQQDEAYKAVEEATRAAADAQRLFRDMALDAFDAIVLGGEKAGDVIGRLGKSIASAAIEAAVLGTGPIAALLKGQTIASVRTGPEADAGAASQSSAAAIGKATGKSVGDRLDSVFGAGKGAKTLQNFGYGSTAASITGGSGIAGGLGGAVGGEIAGKFLTQALGSFAGPLGSIAGGVLGGVIGKLFKKAMPSGAVSITGVEASSYSGSGKYADALNSVASTVQGQVQDIAKSLGGALGAFGVAIGKNGDWYHVSGDAGADVAAKHPKSPLIYEGKDEGAAIAAAIANAIADGAVLGLSARVQKAIQSSTDVDKALAEALKVQDLELLIGGITATIDKSFRDFETQAKERVRLATAYGFDLVEIEKRNGQDRVALAQQLAAQQVGSLQKLIEEMTQGSLFEGTALDKIAVLNTAIDKAKLDLDAGVDGAADTLTSLFQQRLATSKDAYGTTSGYAADRTATLDAARSAVAAANARITAAQSASISSSDPALATTNAALDENNDQNARMIAALETNNALLTRLGGGVSPSFDASKLGAV